MKFKAGQQDATLPEDCDTDAISFVAYSFDDGDRFGYEMTKVQGAMFDQIMGGLSADAVGVPAIFAVKGGRIFVYPRPDRSGSLRVFYKPLTPTKEA